MAAPLQAKVLGIEKLEQRLRARGGNAIAHVAKAVADGAIAVQNDMRKAVAKGPNSGNVYRSAVSKAQHQASAPGEAPASDSGTLLRSINHTISSNKLEADVGVFGVPYAHRLEYGGRDKRGGYIAPRPYLRPALKRNQKLIVKGIADAVRRALG